jgi:peptide deformylase
MEILKYPHPSLFKKCDPVTVFGPELKVLLDSMYEIMVEKHGMGLAANQVGLLYSMFVMLTWDEDVLYVINPRIIRKSLVSAKLSEGCLSAPGEYLQLDERSEWVEIEFQNEKGELQKRVFNAIFAVCVQHEMDHLNGKSHLQSRSLPKMKRKMLAKKWGFK